MEKDPRRRIPPLFKCTPRGGLVPSSAETLQDRVGEATDDGPIVPLCDATVLQRYKACGRVAALALVNALPLGCRFGGYFLRLVQGNPPTELAEMQAELLAEERHDAKNRSTLMASAELLETSLSQLGLEDMLMPSRSLTGMSDEHDATTEPLAAPLFEEVETPVTDSTKACYVGRWLKHKLVQGIEQQASAFREGVHDVLAPEVLSLLTAAELGAVWGGEEVGPAQLSAWRAAWVVSPDCALQAELLGSWLEEQSGARRAEVLRFATGSSRLSGKRLTMQISRQHSPAVIQPTAENGLSGPTALAKAATCSCTLYLPPWQTAGELNEGLDATLAFGGGFGLV